MALMTSESEYLTTEEVARTVRLSRTTVIQLIERGELPATRFGKVWRIKQSDLDEYIRRYTTKQKDESSEQ